MDDTPLARQLSPGAVAMLRALKRRRVRDWVVSAPVVGAALVLVWLCATAPPPAITRDTYDRIAPGMTDREVERLVGTRPGGYECFLAPGEQVGEVWGPPVRSAGWGSRDGILSVAFDAAGRVCAKSLEYHQDAESTAPPRGDWWSRLKTRSRPARYPYATYLGPF